MLDIALNPRQQEIVHLAREHGHITVDELVGTLGVTHQTVRRDVNMLCEAGILLRFHGGAAFRSSTSNLPYEARQESLTAEKQAIARTVAEQIPDHSSVFIDIGTTAEAVAQELRRRSNLRIVTNNLNVANLLAKRDDYEVTICGGTLRGRDMAISGETATEFVRRFRVDFAILGIVALADDGSILDFFIDEEPLTRAIIECGRQVFVVADHSKFGRQATAKVAHIRDVHAVFTDTDPGPVWTKLFETEKVHLYLPSDVTT